MELTEIIAKNLVALRKNKGITQFELAEKLNYSDKSISKWERGDGTPDIETLTKIAAFYKVSVDFIVHEHKDLKRFIRIKGLIGGQKLLISICSATLVWIIATFIFASLCWAGHGNEAYYVFIAAVPIMLIVLIVFNCIWGKVWIGLILSSALLWTLALCIYFVIPEYQVLCFIIPIPIQITLIFFYGLRILNISLRRKKRENDKIEADN